LEHAIGMILESPASFLETSISSTQSHEVKPACSNSVIVTNRADTESLDTAVGPACISIEKHGALSPSLLDDSAQSTSLAQQKLADAVAAANTRKAEEALQEGADARALDSTKSPVLHSMLASVNHGRVLERHRSMLSLLMQGHADPNIADGRGCNFAHRLAESGAVALLDELLKAERLDLEAADALGHTPLHKSAAAGHTSTVMLLMQYGAARDARDLEQHSPADIAASKGNEEVLDELLERPRIVHLVHRMPCANVHAPDCATFADAPGGQSSSALAAKEVGNTYLKAGNYPKAIEHYTTGINNAKDDEKTVVADCYNNRAAAHVQLKNYENVVADATECLIRSPNNGKALVRRAQAYQQLEKLKAAYVDVVAAMRCELSGGFTKIAQSVHKEVRAMLQEDGVDVDSLDPDGPPPIVGPGVKNTFQSRYMFMRPPTVFAVPRSRLPSGRELYTLAWRQVTCNAELQPEFTFDLRITNWDAEDEGTVILCDDFAVELSRRGTLAMEWKQTPDGLHTSEIQIHSTATELRSEESQSITLSSCLDALVKEQTLSSADAWHCPKCDKQQQVSIRSIIDRMPSILVLHLKRFRYTSRRRDKISALIDVPIRDLDLAPWISSSGCSKFDLFAVVNHIGLFGGGHYTANARSSSQLCGQGTGLWRHFNDSLCKPVDEAQLINRDAYVLFYVRQELP